ncbi:tRNA uridine-5-carboxymethylaminomethyl(34) synthesis GTPase MnmE [Wolbachia endosymbiont of Howardula sp.]|uniref:tRNA uridine-5-carboxymethylaminomethyl(34) synthesis GTPase MnmE n=1 Tax=Wolbachia endosymbiont of Howardula sp. TaxID=2916816 RepID=UPI00217E6546|nr:tRNA uridine-5-carboxymethylaminomethyl(34) synthesis GTPase MnmE [Wolbachia endosymbiont of Howardula sp.]UWI82998.1 tRNA uridine-5-carboxymethylaminomethyl(34) synthesis GTPase MnmE [Wolbachia endosymbiont of Howardula sp.]
MEYIDNTIFALSTPYGKSGIAIIRISGRNALNTLSHLHVNVKLQPRYATLVDIYDRTHQLIDHGMLLYFPAPNSFTGEDVIELQVHGSIAVIKMIMEELSKIFVIAQPGEFSLRAFLNGKYDLTKIEGIADLIDAQTAIQARQAIRQMSGALENVYNIWRTTLINIQSKILVYMDFPEEIPIDINELKEINNIVQSLILSIQDHINDKRGERIREGGLHIVLTGEPNVGKSTLFNVLVKRDAAIVSKFPGTTRDILESHLEIGGFPIILSDTAGIRESIDPIELEGIRRAQKIALDADLRILLLPFTQNVTLMAQVHQDNNTIYVFSKADTINNDESIFINGIEWIPISILSGIGIRKLLAVIQHKIEQKFACNIKDHPLITRQRHRNCMQHALDYLQNFNLNNPIELMLENIRLAARELDIMTGIISNEEILDNIFSNFCIGK